MDSILVLPQMYTFHSNIFPFIAKCPTEIINNSLIAQLLSKLDVYCHLGSLRFLPSDTNTLI